MIDIIYYIKRIMYGVVFIIIYYTLIWMIRKFRIMEIENKIYELKKNGKSRRKDI